VPTEADGQSVTIVVTGATLASWLGPGSSKAPEAAASTTAKTGTTTITRYLASLGTARRQSRIR
jgi:hypothetical protein